MRPCTRMRALAVVAMCGVLAALVVGAEPAAAHPFGPPPTATVGGAGQQVTVAWTATTDDLLLVGERLGLLPPGSAAAALEGVVQVAPSAAASAALSASPELHDLLTRRITVTQDGTACPAAVEPGLDFVTQGARLSFTCPTPVDAVELGVTMLHDVDPTYRTFVVAASGGDGQAVLTSAAPRAAWDVGAGLPVAGAPGRRGGSAGGATGPAARGATTESAAVGTGPFEGRFVALVDAPPSGAVPVVLGLLLAAAIGAAHALAPGHGKAVTAAYLMGRRGRPRDAVALGLAVATMHSASTLVLGLAFAAVDRAQPAAAAVTPLLALAAGLAVLGLGVRRCAVELPRLRRVAPVGVHRGGPGHDGVRGDGESAHERAHVHTHGGPDPEHAPLSRRGLVALGLSGGLLPSPSAFLVLATALVGGRPGLGVALVVAFSAGLAATIAVVGLATLRGRALIAARAPGSDGLARVTATLPALSAVAVLAGGLLLTVRAASGL